MSSRSYYYYIPAFEQQAINLANTLANKQNLKKLYIVHKDTDSTIGRSIPDDPSYEKYVVDDLFHYADLLNSVKSYVGFNSGSTLLAAPIKEYFNPELDIHYYTPQGDNELWHFPNTIMYPF